MDVVDAVASATCFCNFHIASFAKERHRDGGVDQYQSPSASGTVAVDRTVELEVQQ